VFRQSQSKRPEGLLDFKPKKHGYLRYLSTAPHERRAPVFCDLAKDVPPVLTGGHRHFQHALTTCSYHVATGRIYAVWEDRMSESPASMMAMVEQRKSLPQAVPSSICITESHKSVIDVPSKVSQAESFFSGLQSINVLQSLQMKLLRKTCDFC
jgi:hypothetical protein